MHFDPPFEEFQQDSAAIDVQNHIYYFYNFSSPSSDVVYLTGVDLLKKKVVSNVLLDKEGGQNAQYLWWNYPSNRALLAINGWVVSGSVWRRLLCSREGKMKKKEWECARAKGKKMDDY